MPFKKLILLSLFMYNANSFSMQFFRNLRNKWKTRQTKTIKTPPFFKRGSKRTQFKETSYTSKTGAKKFSMLPIVTTMALVPLVISDEEKKEDHEKLKDLLSQENFDQDTKNQIYALLKKYGYTEETMYALLEGFVSYTEQLYNKGIFDIPTISYIGYGGVASNSGIVINEKWLGIAEKELWGKTIKEFDSKDLQYINIAELKISVVDDIWSLMPWILKNKLRLDEYRSREFNINLSDPLQMITIISASTLDIPSRNRYPFFMTKEDEKIMEKPTFRSMLAHLILLDKFNCKLASLSQDEQKTIFNKEFFDLAERYKANQDSYRGEQLMRSMVYDELKMLENIEKHCEGAGCNWIHERIKAFNRNFPGWQKFFLAQESSKKSGIVFSPTTYESISVKTTPDKAKSKTYSLWQRILNYWWPNYYYPKNK